jgi:uncharacterized membrane protein
MRRSGFDWALEVVSLASLAAIIAVVATHWNELPNIVPKHFGASGKPKGWGGKNNLWILPGTSVGLYLLLTLAARYQQLINLPISVDRSRPEVRQILFRFTNALKAVILIILFYLSRASINTALGKANGLGRRSLPIILVAIAVPLAYYLVKLRRYHAG